MKQKIILSLTFLFALLIFPLVNADIIIQEVDKTSGIILNGTLNVELKDAIVEINMTHANSEFSQGYLKAVFYVYSNEDEIVYSKVYLKAKGKECYSGSCEDVDVAEHSTSFNINNDIEPGRVKFPSKGVSSFAEIYEIGDEKFAGVEFELLPKQTNIIKVYQEINIPFEYYLDSLSTFSKAEHEKITIYGDNLNAQFNDEYPVKKVSKNEWVWEYSDINNKDQNLKDVLIISVRDSPEPKTFFQKIIDWFINLFR